MYRTRGISCCLDYCPAPSFWFLAAPAVPLLQPALSLAIGTPTLPTAGPSSQLNLPVAIPAVLSSNLSQYLSFRALKDSPSTLERRLINLYEAQIGVTRRSESCLVKSRPIVGRVPFCSFCWRNARGEELQRECCCEHNTAMAMR